MSPYLFTMKTLIRRLFRVADSSSSSGYLPLEAANKNPRRRRRAGLVPVYVGEEMERFTVRAELLSRPAMAELLERSAQEYGYEQRGVLLIPCPVPLFRAALRSLGCDGL